MSICHLSACQSLKIFKFLEIHNERERESSKCKERGEKEEHDNKKLDRQIDKWTIGQIINYMHSKE